MAASSDRLAELRDLDPYEFEHYVASVWEARGWETEVQQQSRDQGIDVIAKKTDPFEQTQVIQAKRYGPNTKVGSPEIQQYASLRTQVPESDAVVVVTTGEFTDDARDLAEQLNVKLVDGQQLLDMDPDLTRPAEERAPSRQKDTVRETAGGVASAIHTLATVSLGYEPADLEDWFNAAVRLFVILLIAYIFLFRVLPIVLR